MPRHRFLDPAARGRRATTLVCDGRSYRHDEIETGVRIGAALQQRGVSCGDRVAIFMDRSAGTVAALSAAFLQARPVVVEVLSERSVQGRDFYGAAAARRAQGRM